MMRIPSFEGDPEKFISRVGETVRMLGHTYEYWMKGRPAINAARWLVEEKRVPSRTLPPSTFIDCLTAELASLPSVAGQAPNLDTAISAVVTKVSKRVAGGREPRFSEFQYQATRTFLVSQFSKSVGAHRASIITAGVGLGKTLGFALGALIAALEGALGGDRVHRTYLLIYPRRALAMD